MPYRTTQKSERRKAAMRAKLLASARTLFVTQGYEATSIQQIVQAAGTSTGNCYFYFPNKEALLLAVADEFKQEIASTIDAAMERTPPGYGRLAVAIYFGVTALLEQADVARLVLAQTAHPSLRPDAFELFTTRVSSFFESSPDLLIDPSPEMVAHAWQGAIFHVLESAVAGLLTQSPATIGLFLVRWNLQALGLPLDQVEQAQAVLSDTLKATLGKTSGLKCTL